MKSQFTCFSHQSINLMIYRIIRLTSPNLNYFIVCGALILYGSVYIRMARTNNATFWKVNCHVSGDTADVYIYFFSTFHPQMIIWTLFLGYCLCFNPYLAKIWRIYYIFHDPTSKKKVFLQCSNLLYMFKHKHTCTYCIMACMYYVIVYNFIRKIIMNDIYYEYMVIMYLLICFYIYYNVKDCMAAFVWTERNRMTFASNC